MPICITCNTPVKNLYTTYSKADDRSLGKGVRLTQCPKCKRFADKYVEHDYVVLFIDLVLIKPQVYRHLLFNRLGRSDDTFNPSILRLGILLILFDVYITWARIEKTTNEQQHHDRQISAFAQAPIITQYLFFLTLNIVATLAQHLTIRLLVRHVIMRDWQRDRRVFVVNNDAGREQGQRHGLTWRSSDTTSLARQERDANVVFHVAPMTRSSTSHHHETATRKTSPSPQRHMRSAFPQHDNNNSAIMTTTGLSIDADTNTSVDARAQAQTYSSSSRSKLTSNPARESTSSLPPPPATTTPTRTISQTTTPSAISTALLVSSCTKLFPILLVIWPTTTTTTISSSTISPSSSTPSNSPASFTHRANSYIGWIVLLNNIEALQILLNCEYLVAGAVSVAGMVARWAVEGWLLNAAGLVGGNAGNNSSNTYGEGPITDLINIYKQFF